MSLEISEETAARIAEKARQEGLSVDALLLRLVNDCTDIETDRASVPASPEVPILHLGPMDALHRRDIYDDVR